MRDQVRLTGKSFITANSKGTRFENHTHIQTGLLSVSRGFSILSTCVFLFYGGRMREGSIVARKKNSKKPKTYTKVNHIRTGDIFK